MDSTLLALETSSSLCSVALLRGNPQAGALTSLAYEGGMQTHTERLLPMAYQLLAAAQLTPDDLHGVAVGQGPGAFTGLRVACSVAQGIALAQGVPVIPIGSLQAIAAQVPVQRGQVVVVAADARMGEVYLAAYQRCLGAQNEAGVGQERGGEADVDRRGNDEADVGQVGKGEADVSRVGSDEADAGQGKRERVLQPPLLLAAADVVPWIVNHLPTWRAHRERLTLVLSGDAWAVYADQMRPLPGWVHYPTQPPHARDIVRLAYPAWRRGEGVSAEAVSPLYVRDRVAFTTAERLQGQAGNPQVKPGLQVAMGAMQESDLEAVAQIEASVQAFPWTRRSFAEARAAGYDTCVLRGATPILGFCVLMHAPDVSHLLVLTVAPAWQRHGLASRLIEWCVARAKEHGTQGLLVEVRPSNHAARAFYAQQGFLHVGVRQAYYPAENAQREDAWVMQKCFEKDPVIEE